MLTSIQNGAPIMMENALKLEWEIIIVNTQANKVSLLIVETCLKATVTFEDEFTFSLRSI